MIAGHVHEAGALVCVDGVAFAPHRAMEVGTWNVDFYLFSCYKLFGPHIGCFYGKRELLRTARGQHHYFIGEDQLPGKMNPAGPQHEIIASLAGIADYIDALAEHHFKVPPDGLNQRACAVSTLVEARENDICTKVLDFLAHKSRVRLLGLTADSSNSRPGHRVPTFAFTVEGMASADVPARLEADRTVVASGFGGTEVFVNRDEAGTGGTRRDNWRLSAG